MLRASGFLAAILVVCSGIASAQTPNAVPLINQPLIPTAVAPGGPDLQLTVQGTGFVPASVVEWNGIALATTFVNQGKLVATVPAGNVAVNSTAQVTVNSPAPGGGTSNAMLFSVTNSAPTLAFSASTIGAELAPSGVLQADFNGDGKADLAVFNSCGSDPACAANGTVSILLGNGDGTFTSKGDLTPIGHPVGGVAGDFNGDGLLDLAVISEPNCQGCAEVTVFQGNGDGTFAQVYKARGLDGKYFGIVAGDFNNDGALDLAVPAVAFDIGFITVLMGNGDGTFTPGTTISAPDAYNPSGVAVGDFNGDGILDLAVSDDNNSSGNSLAKILLGNGDGTFNAAASQPATNLVNPQGVTAGDFNGDGILDLAYADVASGSLAVLLGKGDGTFTQKSGEPAASGANFVATADLNGDGKLDLVLDTMVYLGNGDGSFQAGQNLPAQGSLPATIGDFNGDGGLDLALADSANNVVDLMVQSASQRAQVTMAIASSPNPSTYGQAVVFAALITTSNGGAATGGVTFFDGKRTLRTVPVTGNAASLKLTGLGAGTHQITAVYGGDSNFLGAASPSLMQTVALANSTTSLQSSVNPGYVNQVITLTATVTPQFTGMPTGNITFREGMTALGVVPLARGVASFQVSYSTPGDRFFTATYSGDGNFQASVSRTLTEHIRPLPATTHISLVTSGTPSSLGQSVTFTATLASNAGIPPDGETVTFSSEGATLAVAPLSGGRAAFTTSTLDARRHVIKVSYAGDATFKAASGRVEQLVNPYPTTTSLTSSPNPATPDQLVTFRATVSSSGPKPPTGTVLFRNGTTSLGAAMLDASGTASITRKKLPVGTLVITATYSGDQESARSSSAALGQIVQ